ncbi:hypothetical protein HDU96_003996 [Phlyctochytrium bullatum]|nr:hypothetical protein HDU96_003996 [Phlyctochytrium bullatum]
MSGRTAQSEWIDQREETGLNATIDQWMAVSELNGQQNAQTELNDHHPATIDPLLIEMIENDSIVDRIGPRMVPQETFERGPESRKLVVKESVRSVQTEMIAEKEYHATVRSVRTGHRSEGTGPRTEPTAARGWIDQTARSGQIGRNASIVNELNVKSGHENEVIQVEGTGKEITENFQERGHVIQDPARDREIRREREGERREPDRGQGENRSRDPRLQAKKPQENPGVERNINNLLAQINDFDFDEGEGPAPPPKTPTSTAPTPRTAVTELPSGVKIAARGSSRNQVSSRDGSPSGPVPPERRRRPTNDKEMLRAAIGDRVPGESRGFAKRGGDEPPGSGSQISDVDSLAKSPSRENISPRLAGRTVTTNSASSRGAQTPKVPGETVATPNLPTRRRGSAGSEVSAETEGSKIVPRTTPKREDSARPDRFIPDSVRTARNLAAPSERSRSPVSTVNPSDVGRVDSRSDAQNSKFGARDRSKSRERSRSNDPITMGNRLGQDDASAAGSAPNRKHMSGTSVSSFPEPADPAVIADMLQDALQEAKSYTIYNLDRFEEKRKEFAVLSSQVTSLQNRLTLESRIREAALALTKTNTDKSQARAAQEQLATANRKVDAIATDLWKVTGKLMEVERVVLKHTAGVLRWGVLNGKGMSGDGSGTGSTDSSKAMLAATEEKLKSAESKIRESDREISILKSTVVRLESEADPLKGEVRDLKKQLDREKEDRSRSERALERKIRDFEADLLSARSSARPKSPTTPSASDFNRMKLDLATARADYATASEELSSTREKLSQAQRQLDEDLVSMEEKDRMISDLLAELEEATNQLEMREKAAAAAVAAVGDGASLTERRLREQVATLEAQLSKAKKADGALSGTYGGNRNSVFIREQVSKQVNAQTEGLRSTLGTQLKEAVAERDRLQNLLNSERRRVRELEDSMSSRSRSRPYGSTESDTEDEDTSKYASRSGSAKTRDKINGVRRKGSFVESETTVLNEDDLRSLKKLWAELPSLTSRDVASPRNRTPPLSPGARGGFDKDEITMFNVSDLVQKVNKLAAEKKDLQVRLESAESGLRNAKSDYTSASRDASTFESRERELKADIRSLERTVERLESDLSFAKKQLKDVEALNSTSSSSASQKLEEIQSSHAREMQRLADKHERAMRDLERDLTDSFERKKREIERDAQLAQDRKLRDLQRELSQENDSRSQDVILKMEDEIIALRAEVDRKIEDLVNLERERDEYMARLQDMENVFRTQAMEIETAHKAEIEGLRESHERELKEATNAERVKHDRVIEDLEYEIGELKRKLDDAKKSSDTDVRRQIQEVEDKAAEDLRRRLEASEQIFREQLLEVQQAHDDEKEQQEVAHREEIQRVRDQCSRDKQRELDILRSQLENSSRSIESDLLSKLDRETDSLKASHAAAMEQMKSRHDEEMEQLREDHKEALEQMQNRLGRSEAALVTTKSQFFQDRERLQETIDDLERQVRTFKQQELEQSGQFSSKTREYEDTIDRLRYDLQAAQTLADQMKDDTDRKQREIALLEQKHKQQLAAMQAECDERVRELEKHMEEFESVRGELESVERDYMAELSKHDTERLQAERALAESKEAQNMLRQQLDLLQRKLDEAQREVQEARSSATPRVTDRATERALQSEIERMQETIVDLKTAKNELLEELDDQAIRVQSLQNEMDGMRKEYDKIKRGNQDFDAERKRFETLVTAQREEISNLQERLQDLSVDKLGGGNASNEPPSTQKLRTEFRKMVADLRAEYSAQVSREANLRSQLEAQLRAAQKDRDEDLYNKANTGTQTNLRWLTGDTPQRLHYA